MQIFSVKICLHAFSYLISKTLLIFKFICSLTRLKQAHLIDYLVTLYVGARPDNGGNDRPEIE